MKRVLVVPDGHYFKDINGDIYAENTYTYDFFRRYLLAFDEVYVLARVSDNNFDKKRVKKASGENVYFVELPDYHGAFEQLKHRKKSISITKKALSKVDCVILRVPSATSSMIWRLCFNGKVKTGLEVVADPEDCFAKGTMNGFIRIAVQKAWTYQLKKMCKLANGVAYVTSEYLQKKYPCKAMLQSDNQCFTANYSSVCLKTEDFDKERDFHDKTSWTIVHVCNYISNYRKGHLVVLDVLAKLLKNENDVNVRFIGDGDKVQEFSDYAKKIGVDSHVVWVGRLFNSGELKAELQNADLTLFPTMAEGLPRALLEAMAVGLVCVSTPVGGVPELLPKELLCDYDDIDGYYRVIKSLIDDPIKMNSYSKMNINKASEYKEDLLNEKRKAFYEKLANL